MSFEEPQYRWAFAYHKPITTLTSSNNTLNLTTINIVFEFPEKVSFDEARLLRDEYVIKNFKRLCYEKGVCLYES